MKRFGKLLYDEDVEHWRFEDRHGAWWLHSGDVLALHLGERYVQGRIEHAEGWYVLLGDARLTLWHKGTYAVRMDKQ